MDPAAPPPQQPQAQPPMVVGQLPTVLGMHFDTAAAASKIMKWGGGVACFLLGLYSIANASPAHPERTELGMALMAIASSLTGIAIKGQASADVMAQVARALPQVVRDVENMRNNAHMPGTPVTYAEKANRVTTPDPDVTPPAGTPRFSEPPVMGVHLRPADRNVYPPAPEPLRRPPIQP